MNNRRNPNQDTLQLQQMIIFLKSEIAKYKNEVHQLQKNDYYSLALNLEEENLQLKKQQRELSKELLKIKRLFQKEVTTFQMDVQTYEQKRKKLLSSIQRLVAEKNQLQLANQQLAKTLKNTQRKTQSMLSSQKERYQKSFEQSQLDFNEQATKQLNSIQEQLNNAFQDAFGKVEVESNQIKLLLNELKEAREGTTSSEKVVKHSNTLAHLEDQMQIIYNKTTQFEQQLEKKFQMLHNFEKQFIQLTNDIKNNDE
ncbi:MAG: hypothetical protein ABS949_16565 [Solibacillus sp.]